MIALSSFRPFGSSPEHDANTLRAHASWQQAFAWIVYFNNREPRLESPITAFAPLEDFPRIRDMATMASGQSDWVAILNADIFVPPRLIRVQEALERKHAKCAASWRHEFLPDKPAESGRRCDNGLDFFCARPEVWELVAIHVDDRLRIGVGFWDTWLLGFFNTFFQSFLWDITPSRVVFHPRHENRRYGPGFYHNDIPMWGAASMPDAKISV